jgi:hypothetical protein
MENLIVYYGNVLRDGPCGVDVSFCESTTVVVRDMVNVGYAVHPSGVWPSDAGKK